MNDEEKLELARGFVKEHLDRDVEYMSVSEYLIEETPLELDVDDEFTSQIYTLIVNEVARVAAAYPNLVTE